MAYKLVNLERSSKVGVGNGSGQSKLSSNCIYEIENELVNI
jgi:hypothetical protein